MACSRRAAFETILRLGFHCSLGNRGHIKWSWRVIEGLEGLGCRRGTAALHKAYIRVLLV